jgi:hypothetical protein
MSIDWTSVSAISAGLAAIAALVTAIIYARMLKVMARDLTIRQRPYLFVESLNARITGTGIPGEPNIRVRSSKAAEALDLQMENWIYIRNAGPIPARMKPMLVEYRLDGKPINTGMTTTKVAVLFPNQQAHNIASLQSGLRKVLSGESVLTLRIRIDYDHIEADSEERYNSDITLRYVVNENNLWACSWDYDEASGT